jgi:hypothetical protein
VETISQLPSNAFFVPIQGNRRLFAGHSLRHADQGKISG